jgi:hypothetical protein
MSIVIVFSFSTSSTHAFLRPGHMLVETHIGSRFCMTLVVIYLSKHYLRTLKSYENASP